MRLLVSALVWMPLLLVALTSATASASVRTVAVLPLEQGAGGDDYAGLGTALAGMLVTDLSAAPALQLVERQKLSALLAEMKLATSGMIDPKTAQRLGHGLGAELLVTGSFSVVKGTFLMDARVIGVAKGAILKAANASGRVEDFVAIEKGVVEGLLDGLEVKLTLAARRQLLMSAPTEDARAFAQYGKGLEAEDKGDLPTAKQAFEAALARDPRFAQAATALAGLNARITKLQRESSETAADARTRSIQGALAALTPETERKPGFQHTWETLRDFALRQGLLRIRGRHCERYAELAAFLERTKGSWTPWHRHFPGAEHYDRWKLAEANLDARGKELGLVGRGTWFGRRPGELMMHGGGREVSSAKGVLLNGNMQPEKFRDSLVHSMERCFPPAAQIAEWDRWETRIADWKLGATPLWEIYKQGPSTVTVEDGAILYGAYLRATHRGITPEVTARTEAVIARHPEGDADRRSVLSRVRGIVGAAQSRERRIARRLGRDEAALALLAQAVSTRDAARIDLGEPLCGALVDVGAKRAAEALEKWTALAADERPRERARENAADRLADTVASVVLAGCVTADGVADKGAEAVLKRVREAADRRHPELLEDTKCNERIAKLIAGSQGADRAQAAARPAKDAVHHVRAMLSSLYSLRTQRCLLP